MPRKESSDFRAFRGFARSNVLDSSTTSDTPVKLRHQHVAFVTASVDPSASVHQHPHQAATKAGPVSDPARAGRSHRPRETSASESDSDSSDNDNPDVDDDAIQTNVLTDTDLHPPEAAMDRMEIQSSDGSADMDISVSSDEEVHAHQQPTESQPIVIDTVGDASLHMPSTADGKRAEVRASSPTPSSSSEEKVVFSGRDNKARVCRIVPPPAFLIRGSKLICSKVIDDPIHPTKPKTGSGNNVRVCRIGPPPAFLILGSKLISPKVIDDPIYPNKPETAQPSMRNAQRKENLQLVRKHHAPVQEAETDPWADSRSQCETAQGWASSSAQYYPQAPNDSDWNPAPPGMWWRSTAYKRYARGKAAMMDSGLKAIEGCPGDDSPTSSMGKEDFEAISDEDFKGVGEERKVVSKPSTEAKGKTKAVDEEEQAIEGIRKHWKQELERKKADAKAGAKTTSANYVPADYVKVTERFFTTNMNGGRRRKRARKRQNRELKNAIKYGEDYDVPMEVAENDYMANTLSDAADEGPDSFAESSFARSAAQSRPEMMIDGTEVGANETISAHASVNEDSASSSGSDSQDGDADVDSSELEDELEHHEQQKLKDGETLHRRHAEGMTDEQLARVLNLQEELGLGGDEVILVDGAPLEPREKPGNGQRLGGEDCEDDWAGDDGAARAYLDGRRRHKRRTPGNGSGFPSAFALADSVDQYGEAGFDIMDFDRPSLRSKKGRQGQPPPALEGLSDEGLKATIYATWENDRSKKRSRKIRREELRAQGLLGKRGGFLTQKFGEGMSYMQVVEQLRDFLMREDKQEVAFPPMKKTDRHALHFIANAHALRSKSNGRGDQRSIVLHKTTRTQPYNEKEFDTAMAFADRGHNRYKKWQLDSPATNISRVRPGGGRPGRPLAYGDHGKVVGASAPQLGKESSGHKIMEKMGWSAGTALGKDGEGRLDPIPQIVRRGRGGLG